MCYFISVAIPAAAEDTMRAHFGRGFGLIPCENRSVLAAMPTDYRVYVVTSGGCSCEMYAAPGESGFEPKQTDEQKTWRKREKRGWSAAKIERAESQAVSKPHVGPPSWRGLRPDVAERIASVAEHGPVGVVVHWYSGSVVAERITLIRIIRYRRTAFIAAAGSIPSDSVVWVDPTQPAVS